MTWSIIHSYSRKQALSDGVLVEVPPDLAAECGFRVPVACTRAVWEDCGHGRTLTLAVPAHRKTRPGGCGTYSP